MLPKSKRNASKAWKQPFQTSDRKHIKYGNKQYNYKYKTNNYESI